MNKTRRKFICDVIERYKKDYSEEYSQFLDLMDYRRSLLNDQKSAVLTGQKEIRNAATLPEKVMSQITYVLDGIEEERFLESKGEMKWFIKKFPEFLLPSSY